MPGYLHSNKMNKLYSLARVYSNKTKIILAKYTWTKFGTNKKSWFILLLLFSFDTFFLREKDYFFKIFSGLRIFVNQLGSYLGLYCLITLLSYMVNKKFHYKIWVFVLILLIYQVESSHYQTYKELLSGFGVGFFFDNIKLTLELGKDNIPISRIITITSFSLLVIILLIWNKTKPAKGYFILPSLFFILIISFSTLHWYAIPNQQNSLISFWSAWVDYAKNITWKNIKHDIPIVQRNEFHKKGPNIIWIIGESASVEHMGIYGYWRNNTPKLEAMRKQGEMIVARNAVGIGVHTRTSVPYMLNGIQGIDPQGLIYTQPSIFAYAKAQGYSTAFITAQDLRWGDIDKLLIDKNVDFFRDGNYYSPNVSIHKGADDMVILEQGIKNILQNSKQPYFLVVQMDGSHYPYNTHSPANIKKYLPERSPNDFNSYDNTIVYLDIFLHNLQKMLRSFDPSAWMFYCSDHGQNIGGTEGDFHYGYAMNIVRVPYFIFPPKDKMPQMEKVTKAPVSQVDIFPTILELMQIKPVKEIDGFSLLQDINPERKRVVSMYMNTFNPDPSAIVVNPNLSSTYIDFNRKSATLPDKRTVIKYQELPSDIKDFFANRIK